MQLQNDTLFRICFVSSTLLRNCLVLKWCIRLFNRFFGPSVSYVFVSMLNISSKDMNILLQQCDASFQHLKVHKRPSIWRHLTCSTISFVQDVSCLFISGTCMYDNDYSTKHNFPPKKVERHNICSKKNCLWNINAHIKIY